MDFQKDVLPYATAKGITYPLLMGEKDGLAAVNALGMDPAFPFTVFADAQGNIVAVKVGELHADEARLILGQVTARRCRQARPARGPQRGLRGAAQPRHCARATALGRLDGEWRKVVISRNFTGKGTQTPAT